MTPPETHPNNTSSIPSSNTAPSNLGDLAQRFFDSVNPASAEGRTENDSDGQEPSASHAAEQNSSSTNNNRKKRHSFPCTQFGNADRLVYYFGGSIRYCPQWKAWFVWDGRRWMKSAEELVQNMAYQTVRMIRNEKDGVSEKDLSAEEVSKIKEAIRDWARRSETAHQQAAMVKIATSKPELHVTPEQFDRDPMLFNVQNGTIDLRSGKLLSHRRDDLITSVSPVIYDPDAKCPIFEAFLRRIFGDDDEVIDFMQRALGYALTGCVSEKVLFTLDGRGDNGKTSLLEIVKDVQGKDYSGTVNIETLTKKGSESERLHTIAELHGKRFVTASEAEEGEALRESFIKHLTGMGRLKGRHLYSSAFEFDPVFKIFLDANHKPRIQSSDPAIWNRQRLIPFKVSIPRAEQDRQLKDKLRSESSGILAWLVQGALLWQKYGLGYPTAIAQATDEYRAEMDAIHQFVQDCCETGADYRVNPTDVYDAYKTWCGRQGCPPLAPNAFGSKLSQRGYETQKSNGGRWRVGIRLKDTVSQFDPGV